jgi:S1-C subfamily serine protease
MGDSGGPVFDLDGRLVAINSRIGIEATSNIHVPIDTFTRDWERLAKGEQWGSRTGPYFARGLGGPDAVPPARASLGLRVLDDMVVQTVAYGQAAEKAGLQSNDVITKFAGKPVQTQDDLKALLAKQKPGDTVSVEFRRNGVVKTANIKLDAAQP